MPIQISIWLIDDEFVRDKQKTWINGLTGGAAPLSG